MIDIIEIKPGKLTRQFLNFSDEIYRNDPNYIAPLKIDVKKLLSKKKHPFYQHGDTASFLAFKNKKIVGRITAIKNDAHNKYYNDKVGFFGLFESINDQKVANSLFNAAANWLKSQGLTAMRGPFNLSSNDSQGLLIKGFDTPPPYLLTHNPKYYADLCKDFGMGIKYKMLSYHLPKIKSIVDEDNRYIKSCLRLEESLKNRQNITFKYLNKKNITSEIRTFIYLYNKCFVINTDNFVPITFEEVESHISLMLRILNEKLYCVAYQGNNPIGFACAIPNFNLLIKKLPNGKLFSFRLFSLLFMLRKPIRLINFKILGIVPEYSSNLSIAPVLTYKILSNASNLYYKDANLSVVHQDNSKMRSAAENYGATIDKEYGLYETAI